MILYKYCRYLKEITEEEFKLVEDEWKKSLDPNEYDLDKAKLNNDVEWVQFLIKRLQEI